MAEQLTDADFQKIKLQTVQLVKCRRYQEARDLLMRTFTTFFNPPHREKWLVGALFILDALIPESDQHG